MIFMVGIILWSGFWTVRHFVAEAYCNTVSNSTLNRDRNPPLNEIKQAIWWDPWNAAYRHKLGLELMRMRDKNISAQQSYVYNKANKMETVAAFEQAIRLNPFIAQYHQRLGWEYTYLWKEPDYHKKWLPAADISMGRAAYFAGQKNPSLHVDLGHYWTMRSKSLDPSDSRWRSSWAKACRHYKKAQVIDGSTPMVKTIIKYIWTFYPDKSFVLEALEERFHPQAEKLLTAME